MVFKFDLINHNLRTTYFRFFEGVSGRDPGRVILSAPSEAPNDGEHRRHEHDDRERPETVQREGHEEITFNKRFDR